MSNSPPGKLSNPVGRPHNRKAINDDGKKKIQRLIVHWTVFFCFFNGAYRWLDHLNRCATKNEAHQCLVI